MNFSTTQMAVIHLSVLAVVMTAIFAIHAHVASRNRGKHVAAALSVVLVQFSLFFLPAQVSAYNLTQELLDISDTANVFLWYAIVACAAVVAFLLVAAINALRR